ncbi:hypothetical protein AOLI_G00103820 [Acnodon oligacanthus]
MGCDDHTGQQAALILSPNTRKAEKQKVCCCRPAGSASSVTTVLQHQQSGEAEDLDHHKGCSVDEMNDLLLQVFSCSKYPLAGIF